MDVLPDLVPEWRHFDGRDELYRRVREAASAIVDRDLAVEARRLRETGMTLDGIGGRLHRSGNIIRRLLAEYPAEDPVQGG
jgi:hypothetical protein